MWETKKGITFMIVLAFVFSAFGSILATSSSVVRSDTSVPFAVYGGSGTVDLSISDNDITFSDSTPVEGSTVTIEAIVHGDQSIAPSLHHYGKVLPVGGFGEGLHIYTPSVMQNDDGSYVMWYTGDDDDGVPYKQRIFRAISPDGINWTKTGISMDYGGTDMQNGVLHPFVLKDDTGLYHMWHTGVGYSGGYRFHIHYATSTDGITWQKMGREFTYGASFQPDGVFAPYVYFDGTEWFMWYNGVSWGPDISRINFAHKANLADSWIFEGTVIDIDGPYDNAGAYYSHVLPTDSGYEMYYTGRDTSENYRILHATSADGLSWTRNGIFMEADSDVGTIRVASSYVVYEDGIQKIWYAGNDGSHWEMYYAEKYGHDANDATCTVSFYLDSIAPENLIHREYEVFVPADGSTFLSTVWITEVGDHEIIVDVTYVNPVDIDYSNNVASAMISVDANPGIVDLSITSDDIAFSDPSPSLGDEVVIEATVHNGPVSESLIDWKVCGEFHLTYRSHPDGCEVARPIFIGDNDNNVGVFVYGGNSVINSKRDTISLRAFGETFAVHYSSSGGSGYYDDGYYVEFWYQSSDNRFYAKLCDAADHSIVYTTGDIEAGNFSFDALSVGSSLGTEEVGWDGVPVIYEGWVDDVEFHWSEDGISGYENSLYYDFSTSDGFVKVDDQTHSNVYIDSLDENVFFHADRLDTINSGERMENSLPTLLTNTAGQSTSDWVKYGIVVDIGDPANEYRISAPCVLKMPNGTYRMWHTLDPYINSYYYRIHHAFSYDGINWHKQGIAIDLGGSYAEHGVAHPFVMIADDGTYHMWYTGVGYSRGYRYYIHHAVSYDNGCTWTKLGRELTYGSAADPDGTAAPYVMYDGVEWHMWYTGTDWTPLENRICYAHKANLNDPWIKEGVVINNDGPFDNPHAYFPWVVPTDDGYEMYYTGYDAASTMCLLHATSPDGLTWTRTGVVIESTLPEESRTGIGCVLYEGSTTKCWYSGYNEPNWKIFYAEKTPATQALDATCTVSFYLDSISPENLIHREYDVFVPGGGTATVTAYWEIDVIGQHDIIVDITDSDPTEEDLTNNTASSSIIIQAPGPATATATGPQGAYHDPVITLTYTWTDSPVLVDLFYSTDNGETWNYIGTDNTIDGTFDWVPDTNSGPKPSKYYWIANAVGGLDDVGIPADGTDPEAGPFNWKTFDLGMEKTNSKDGGGWYFVSIPLEVNGDALTVLDDVTWGDGEAKWDRIMWYDSSDADDHWKAYDVAQASAGIAQDMPAITNGMGLWIHITRNVGDNCLTTGEGSQPSTSIIPLHAGWNMVGYPSQRTDLTVSEVFSGTGADRIEVFDLNQAYMINAVGPDYLMQPGEAYWVHVPVDTTWIIDW